MNRPSIRIWRPATFLIIGGLVVLFAVFVTLFITPYFKPTTEVRLGNGVYHLWIADSESERVRGLSGVDQLQQHGGLLMDFKANNTWGIWMKDMKIPLDIIWLSKDKEVLYIERDVDHTLGTSRVFMPVRPAWYVIELPAGTVAKDGIERGMKASFNGTISGASQL